jgi:hypothetical protein
LFETMTAGGKLRLVKGKFLLPAVFIAVFAVSRIPGLMPSNFSVAYAFMFCAGAFFPGALAWWLPLATMLATDVALNVFYYHESSPVGYLYLAVNFLVYALLIALGKWFGSKASLLKLVSGGILGAVIFYLVTNTLSWYQDQAYAKNLAGWIQALTSGRPDWHPTTWEMFRNTLLSGALFTAIFGITGKVASESPADKTAGAREPAPAKDQPETEPEEAKA